MNKQTLLEAAGYIELALNSLGRALEQKQYHLVETELENAQQELKNLCEMIQGFPAVAP